MADTPPTPESPAREPGSATYKVTTLQLTVVGESAPSALVVQIEIECEECGTITLQLWGHHVGGVKAALEGVLKDFPALTEAGPLTKLATQAPFTVWPPKSDPQNN